jgi:hypothetical protein
MKYKIPKLIILIISLMIVFFSGDMLKFYHEEGSTKYLTQLGYSEIELLDASFLSRSLKYEVFSEKGNITETDTIYVGLGNGGYTIRYFEYIP